MKKFKSLLFATIFVASTSVAWTTDTAQDLDNAPKTTASKVSRVKGFKKTSEETRAILRSISKQQTKKLGRKPTPAPVLPKSVDMSANCHIFDQGQLGSCTANAISGCFYARQVIEFKASHPRNSVDDIKKALPWLSRLFIYYQERVKENTVNEDAGASIGDGMLSMYQYGAPLESLWPYSDDTDTSNGKIPPFIQKPSVKAFTDAFKHKDLDGVSHDEIDTTKPTVLDAMKRALFNNQPLVIGITLYDSFESDAVAQTGNVPMPDTTQEQELGGHAVLVVGYDDTKKHFKLANSWNTTWGDKGFFYLPYDYFKPELGYCSEAWQMGTVTMPTIALKLGKDLIHGTSDKDLTAANDNNNNHSHHPIVNPFKH